MGTAGGGILIMYSKRLPWLFPPPPSLLPTHSSPLPPLTPIRYTWSAVKPVAVFLLRSSLTEFGRAAAGVSAGADAGAGADVDVGPQRPLASGESLAGAYTRPLLTST